MTEIETKEHAHENKQEQKASTSRDDPPFQGGWWVLGEYAHAGSVPNNVLRPREHMFLCLVCDRVWSPPVEQSRGADEYFDAITSYGKVRATCNACEKENK